jgi:hypothetical protein
VKLEPTAIRLRVVPLARVILHEGLDPKRVERIASSLQLKEELRNPIIVVEDNDDYIVLDGASRSTALKQMDIPHALVQIVSFDEPHIELATWHHILSDFDGQQLLQTARQIPDLSISECSDRDLSKSLYYHDALFGLRLSSGEAFTFSSDADPRSQLSQLNQVVNAYRGVATVQRSIHMRLDEITEQFPDYKVIVFFPVFSLADVLHAARNQVKLPMGITRHVIGGRALGLNIPLAFLASDSSLEEKNAWLENWIEERMRGNVVRLYAEPTFIFEDD